MALDRQTAWWVTRRPACAVMQATTTSAANPPYELPRTRHRLTDPHASTHSWGTGKKKAAHFVCVSGRCKVLGYFLRLNTHSARIMASASVTGLAGIGIGPQAPWVPFLMRPASSAAAPSVPAYLAATSFSAGPTSFMSTLWQAAQGLLLNSASAAAGAAARGVCRLRAAPRANSGGRNFFMGFPQGE